MYNMVMQDEDLLHVLLEEYFCLTKVEEKHPTIPGLALAICFNTTRDITQTLKKWEANDSPYPDSAINKLLSAITRIEDHYLQEGLESKIPAALAKFCLGAYHKVQEPSKTADGQGGGNNMIQIVFENEQTLERLPTVTSLNQLSAPPNTKQDEYEITFDEVM